MAVFTYTATAIGGGPENGAFCYVYTRGTTTPATTYSDVGRTIPRTNPIVADADGRVPPAYFADATQLTFVVKTANGATTLLQVEYDGTGFFISYAQDGQITRFANRYTADGAQTKALTGVVVDDPFQINIYFDAGIVPKANYSVVTDGTDSTITWATNCQPASGVDVYYESAVLQALAPVTVDYTGVDLSDAFPTSTGSGWSAELAKNNTWQTIAVSGTTLNLGAATSNKVRANHSGGNVTSFGTPSDGVRVMVWVIGSMTLKHSGGSLELPGAADIDASVGDYFEAIGANGGTHWEVTEYHIGANAPGDASNLTAIPTGGTTPRSLSAHLADVLNAADFGVTADATESGSVWSGTDNTTNMNAAITALKALITTSANERGVILNLPSGDILVTSWNCTGIRGTGWEIRGNGTRIISKTTGAVIIDLLHSRHGRISNVTAVGDTTTPPRRGWQLGYISSAGTSASNLQRANCWTQGSFTDTAEHNGGSEESTAYGGQRENNYNSATAAGITLDAINLDGRFSLYQTGDLIAKTVTGTTQANPCVITCVGHGYSNGQFVRFAEVGGMTELNGNLYTAANVTSDTFQLSGVNSSGYGAFTSGGYVWRVVATSMVNVQYVNASAFKTNAGNALRICGPVNNLRFYGYVYSASGKNIDVQSNSTVSVSYPHGLDMDIVAEGAASTSVFYFHRAGGPSPTFSDWNVRIFNPQATDQWFEDSNESGAITFHNLRLTIPQNSVTPTNGLFYPTNKFTATVGRISARAFEGIVGAPTNHFGSLCVQDADNWPLPQGAYRLEANLVNGATPTYGIFKGNHRFVGTNASIADEAFDTTAYIEVNGERIALSAQTSAPTSPADGWYYYNSTDKRFYGRANTAWSAFAFVNDNPRPNLLLNGDFAVSQRGTTFTSASTPANSDDTYLLDQWILLSDGNDIVDVYKETTIVPTGRAQAVKLEVETADKKFGILQVLEAKRCADILSGSDQVTLSFKYRNAAADDLTVKLYAAILSWAGTADSVTSDVVGTWGAEDTLPTAALAANWTAEGVTSQLTMTQSFQTATLTATIDTASVKQVAVLIWCDDANGAVDDAVIIADVKLEKGRDATNFVARPYADELQACKRYFERLSATEANTAFADGFNASTTVTRQLMKFAEKRVAPNGTITFSDVTHFRVHEGGGPQTCSAIAESNETTDRCTLSATVASGLTLGRGCLLEANTTDAFIDITAEL